MLAELRDELELVQGASHAFELASYLSGKQTPVFFGSAVNNFGVQLLLDFFVEHAPAPKARATTSREVQPSEEKLAGFVFKIQANMDPQHRDRVAFMRICSGRFEAGMKALHVRSGKEVKLANALTFMASDREIVAEAFPGRRDRHPQPRHGLDRRHLHRRRGHLVHRHPELRAGTVPPRAPARPAQAQGSCRRDWRSSARKARPSSSSR
jgi:hypothetical protein